LEPELDAVKAIPAGNLQAKAMATPGYMTWEKGGSSLEIRTQGQLPDGKPALDEILARGAFVHLEQMAHDH
jgi:hypothetical protein